MLCCHAIQCLDIQYILNLISFVLKAFTETLDQNSNEKNNSARSVRLQLQDGDWALAGDLLWDGVCEQPFTSHHGLDF